MSYTDKRKISAKEMVADIRSGMDNAKLRRKYKLSHEALESVYTKLANAGVLKEFEVRSRLASTSIERPDARQTDSLQGSLCPSCNAAVPTGSDECPVCGIVLSKFVSAETLASPTLVEYPGAVAADSSGTSRWLFVVLSIVVLALIGLALVMWATHRDKQKFEAVSADTTQAIEETSNATEPAEEASSEDSSVVENSDDGSTNANTTAPAFPEHEIQATEKVEEPKKQVAYSRQPIQAPPMQAHEKDEYITGVLRQFTSRDFKKEVVEASKTYPVIFEFYRDT
jgi:flagellar basal body-associated protein FliL